MAKFETKVCLVDKYNEVVCELEEDGFFYKLPKGFYSILAMNLRW